jgi:hypothetical protein
MNKITTITRLERVADSSMSAGSYKLYVICSRLYVLGFKLLRTSLLRLLVTSKVKTRNLELKTYNGLPAFDLGFTASVRASPRPAETICLSRSQDGFLGAIWEFRTLERPFF